MPRRRSQKKAQAPEGPVVRLRHTVRPGSFTQYFYEGQAEVVDGVITLPANRPERIRRAWIQGFRATVDGRIIANLDAHIRSETAEKAEETPVEPTGCCPNECCPDTDTDPCDENCTDTCCEDEKSCCAVTPVDETETAETADEPADAEAEEAGVPAPEGEGDSVGEDSGADSQV